jgi:hypothetical protein
MRQHSPTSKAGEEYIKPFRASHKNKILDGLERLRVGGTQEEIAAVCGLRADQVWKRMIDLIRDGEIFNTGITRTLKSGLQGIVWQKIGLKPVDLSNPKTSSQQKDAKLLKQLTLL